MPKEYGDIIDPYALQETFADSVDEDSISIVNGIFRCNLYSTQIINNQRVRVVVDKVVMPVSGAADSARKVLTAIARVAATSPGEFLAPRDPETRTPEMVN